MPTSRHQPDPSEVLGHLTEMFMATLNPYFAWAVARHCYEEELDLPHEVLIYFGTAATALIGEDTVGNRDSKWGANRDNRVSYERALHFDKQVSKLEQFDDLKEIRSDRAAKWFPDDMLRLVEEERQRFEQEERQRLEKESQGLEKKRQRLEKVRQLTEKERQRMEKELRKRKLSKDEIYRRIAKRIGLSDSAVKKRCLKAQKGEDFRRVLDRRVVDWDDGVINILPRDRIRGS